LKFAFILYLKGADTSKYDKIIRAGTYDKNWLNNTKAIRWKRAHGRGDNICLSIVIDFTNYETTVMFIMNKYAV
jgi:hypothetical protein